MLRQNGEAVQAVAVAAMGSHSKAVAHTAVSLLHKLLHRLAVPRILYDCIPYHAIPGSVGEGVAAWVPLKPSDPSVVPWAEPCAEDTAIARALAERILVASRAEVDAMVSNGNIAESGHEARRRLRCALLCAYACVNALTTTAPTLGVSPAAADARRAAAEPLGVCNWTPAGWEGCSITHDAAALAITVATHTDAAHVYGLNMAISLLEVRLFATSSSTRERNMPRA